MDVSTDWDIESYRTAYESIEHWSLKRDFMEAHKERIPEDRLVCLAQVFANIELMGCKYPDKTMEQVNLLARDIGQEYKEKKKTRLKRTFVKASNAAGAKVKARGQKRKEYVTQQQNKLFARSKPISKEPLKFVKASAGEETDYETVSKGEVGPMATETISQFQSVASERQYNVEKYKKAVMSNIRKTESATNPTLSVTQSGSRIGTSNMTKSGRGIRTMNSLSFRGRGNASCDLSSLIITETECENPATWIDDDSLSDFVIVQREYNAFSTAFSVLNESSAFSRIPLTYKWENMGTECLVTINGKMIASGNGETKKLAREAASVKVLEILSKHCYTLKVLKAHTAEEEVSVGEVASDRVSSSQSSAAGQGTSLDKPIEDDSMGSKLLKMMGWRGGGLGKKGTGITEPIRPPEVFGRGGLGHSQEKGGVCPRFRSRITAIVREFSQGCGMDDLAFSPDFTKEQRAEIHKVSRRFKLKSSSHGSGDNRYLVLSRKFSAKQLICTLSAEGPTDKYELIPPKA